MKLNVEFQDLDKKKRIKRIIAREGLILVGLLVILALQKIILNSEHLNIAILGSYFLYCSIRLIIWGSNSRAGLPKQTLLVRLGGGLLFLAWATFIIIAQDRLYTANDSFAITLGRIFAGFWYVVIVVLVIIILVGIRQKDKQDGTLSKRR